MFVDRVLIELRAGKGGDGCSSMRREKYVPRGGPDGGDGGDGASIVLEARVGVNSLAAYANQRLFRATKGQPGQGSLRHGRKGRDQRLLVPPGTTVIDADQHFVIKDMKHHGEQFVIARGGKGGHGNTHFKSSTNRSPRESTPGDEGETRFVILELKSIADVGFIGKPNAGKSTLLSHITSARPEIADYPFTTKHPNLGIVELSGERCFVAADIPGLIEGASEGVGLGHEFLRHVERAGLLIHLVEPFPADQTDPMENYAAICAELEEYDTSLAKRDQIVVVTKSEIEGSKAVHQALMEETQGPVHLISAIRGDGVQNLLEEIMNRVEQRREDLIAAGEEVLISRESARTPAKQVKRKRLPPHLNGLTANLSNEMQAKDFHLDPDAVETDEEAK
jgi:GTP-binding protein